MTTPLMTVEKVSLRFGGLTAVDCVDICVNPNEVLSIIGPNGAGKTSLFNAITGIYEPTSGKVCVNAASVRDNPRSISSTSIIAICISVIFSHLIFISNIWDKTIAQNYTYGEAFDWTNISKGMSHFYEENYSSLLLFFVVITLIAYFAVRKIEKEFLFCPAVCSKAGLARTFQNIRLFSSMTVFENILVGIRSQQRPLFFEKGLLERDNQRVLTLLEEVGLTEKQNELAVSLSYGERRRVEIARALATNPKVLLLDEPAAGLNPTEGKKLSELIITIKEKGIAVILIEHHMKVVMAISDRIVVLQNGKKIAEGSPEEIKRNQAVVDAYLGTGSTH